MSDELRRDRAPGDRDAADDLGPEMASAEDTVPTVAPEHMDAEPAEPTEPAAGDVPAPDAEVVEPGVDDVEPVEVPEGDAPATEDVELAAERDDAAGTDVIEIVDTTGQPPTTGAAAEAGEERIIVVDGTTPTTDGDALEGDDRFRWHPEHAGKTAAEVRSELVHEIRADQRQHSLAMDGAEEAEHDALASVVSLERRWGQFDFDWAAQDPEALADRIVAFEQERERRQELISWADYRAEGYEADGAAGGETAAPELGTGTKALSLALVVALILLILISVWLL